jgi:hypothetical protein
VLQLGLRPSHFSFRFLQIMHARRFGFGTLELPRAAGSVAPLSASTWLVGSDTMMVSDGEFDDDDMLGVCAASARPVHGNSAPCSDRGEMLIPVTHGRGLRTARRTTNGTRQIQMVGGGSTTLPPKVRASPGGQVSGEVCSLGFSACSGLGT